MRKSLEGITKKMGVTLSVEFKGGGAELPESLFEFEYVSTIQPRHSLTKLILIL